MNKTLRVSALAAPALLLAYGILRLIDGRDGDRGPGLAWNLGHTAFLAAFLLFGVLLVNLRDLVLPETRRRRAIATAATAAGMIGVAAFVWVILGDLFPRFDEAAEVPDPVMVAGPLLFEIGVMTLLVQLAALPPRLLPAWSPVLVFLGFIPIAVNLDLLPLGALLILAGLVPLTAAGRPARSVLARPSAG